MKISINTATGLLHEAQSHGDDATLIRNAENVGISVTVRDIADNELQAWVDAANGITPASKAREAAKQARSLAVEAITVTTTAGNTFDGDETSQTRMARAILALQATGTPSVNWVLSDNSVIQASAAELSEALALAGAAQAALWVL